MIQFSNVKIVSPQGQVLFDNTYRLPITIGRHSNATITIPDAPPDMSRVHVRLSESEDGVVVSDESSLGTEYDGILFNRETRLLKLKDSFSFCRHKVEVNVELPKPSNDDDTKIFLKSAHGAPVLGSDGNQYPPVEISRHNLVCLRDRDNQLKIEVAPIAAINGNLIGSYNLSDMEMIFIVGNSPEQGPVLITSEVNSNFTVKLNRSTVEANRKIPVKEYDLIEIGNVRLEIMKSENSALRCSNKECERLNKYHPQGNCTWCGHRLVLATTAVFEK